MSEAVAPSVRKPFLTDKVDPKAAPYLRIWLLLIALMVYAMILVGGATRLTDSGLSITEWRPLLGAVPPMTDADWSDAFEKYRTMTAQYHQINPDMDLSGFKSIYWWEWSHRQLGRVIGIVFALPFLFFLVTRSVSRRLFPHLLILFALGGLQGLIGWWMVSSGVNSELTSVAPYRLMTHFGLALLIICYCFWLGLDLGTKRIELPKSASPWTNALIWIVGIQMALGALVAGLDAGRGFIDWPLMSGEVVPSTMWVLDPFWKNFFENEATTQFFHRIVAYTLLAISLWTAWKFRNNGALNFPLFAGLVTAQAVLGVITLINSAPLDMALTHQALGTVVLLAATRLAWASRSSTAPQAL